MVRALDITDALRLFAASACTYPLDVIKTRLTVQHMSGKMTARDMAKHVWRTGAKTRVALLVCRTSDWFSRFFFAIYDA